MSINELEKVRIMASPYADVLNKAELSILTNRFERAYEKGKDEGISQEQERVLKIIDEMIKEIVVDYEEGFDKDVYINSRKLKEQINEKKE